MDNVDWDAYWRNAESSAAHLDGGPQDDALEKFWLQFFKTQIASFNTPCSVLDVACGNGAVPRFALSCSRQLPVAASIYGLDDSHAAIREMLRRDSTLCGIAAPVNQMPFADNTFDIVTSQFGIEYAGKEGFPEAVRVLRPGGRFSAVLHLENGAIYRECQVNLQAIESFRHSRILEHFARLFQLVVVDAGMTTKAQVQSCDRQFAAAVAAAEQVFASRGKAVASGTLFRIYQDIGHMYSRLRSYRADELLEWVEVMQGELQTYAGRMSSMLEAALDEFALRELLSKLEQLGMSNTREATLDFGAQAQPSAWVVQAEKAGPVG